MAMAGYRFGMAHRCPRYAWSDTASTGKAVSMLIWSAFLNGPTIFNVHEAVDAWIVVVGEVCWEVASVGCRDVLMS